MAQGGVARPHNLSACPSSHAIHLPRQDQIRRRDLEISRLGSCMGSNPEHQARNDANENMILQLNGTVSDARGQAAGVAGARLEQGAGGAGAR